jgi:type VI secretion system secreted protein VgrG
MEWSTRINLSHQLTMQQVQVTIELETGKKLTQFTRLRIGQYLFGHHSFELEVPFETLEDPQEYFFHQAHQEVCGKGITFSFGPALEEGSFDFSFKGIVTEIVLVNSSDLVNVFLVKGYSPSIQLEDCQTCRTFTNQNLQQIAEAVLENYPRNTLKRRIAPRQGAFLPYVVQYKESNFSFLNRLAAEYGEWFYYNGRELLMGDPPAAKAIPFRVDGMQTCQVSITLRPSQFKMAAYDYLGHEHYASASQGQPVAGLGQFSSFALEESNKLFGQESANVLAKSFATHQKLMEAIRTRKAKAANDLVDFRGSGERPEFTVGDVLEVSGLRPRKGGYTEESFGNYRITEIQHQVDDSGNYSNQFRAIPAAATFPPVKELVVPPLAYSDLARIIDNRDPEKLGRVRVAFFWSSEQKESDWMRVGHPYTADGQGMLFVPEMDAQVLVAYLDNCPEMPFVLTSLYHKNEGSSYTHDRNATKAIHLKGGNSIVSVDDPDKSLQHIYIANTNDLDKAILKVSFADNGLITLKTKGEIVLEAGQGISLKGRDISLNADGKVSISANDIELKAQNGITHEATTTLKLKGLEIKAEADANAEIKANAQLKLSGNATTDISGGALVKVEGAIIKLN